MKFYDSLSDFQTDYSSSILVMGINITDVERYNHVRSFGYNSDEMAYNESALNITINPVRKWYGIPYYNKDIKVLSPFVIQGYVNEFLDIARKHPKETFFITRIACLDRGYIDQDNYTDRDIAPFFKDASDNCIFSKEWKPYLTSEDSTVKIKQKRTILSDQTKANISVARKAKIIPTDKSASARYQVLLIGKGNKSALVEDTNGDPIFFNGYGQAKARLMYWGLTRDQIILVSQLDI